MTQISVGMSRADAAVLTAPVPRPREVVQEPEAMVTDLAEGGTITDGGDLGLLRELTVVREAPGTEAPPAEAPATVVPAATPWSRRLAGRPMAGVDAAVSLAVAFGAAALGTVSLAAAVATALAWPLVLLVVGRYRRPTLGEGRLARPALVLGTGAKVAVLALALSPWLVTVDVVGLAGLVAVLSVASSVPSLVAGRHRPRVVLAGRPRDVREAMLEVQATGTHEVVAACLTRTTTTLGDLPTFLGFEEAADAAHRHQADALVVLPGARLSSTEMRRLHWSLAGTGTELFVGTGLLDVAPQRTRVVSTGGIDVLHVAPAVLGGPRRVLKDVAERAVALVAFVAALPVLAVLCLAIRLESPGAAIFRQQRIGRDGVPFTMLKLRSMGVDAEAERSGLALVNEKDAVLFKIQLDPRITPLGRRLRRYSLDELPQLWNVVRGDMALVGPRPALPSEVAKYDVDPRRRLAVKPGLTGLWQVSGRSDLTWAESVRLDVKYVDNWSLRLDLSILARTVGAVLGHRGAY
ncbi:exopolysaccharide biosynthesis polyprenyl glycosylphosphotransferase [Nocardioides renjunii]|uniref:exopolysaccharide biosynthesis polyprenyl glycosylphosphotransferase n=1 Tax=Nocardioides renjunii TaxID=3095075 RepID=UPI002B0005D8|nr:exopolysaccharide biosynthesis polyprenyl glycosylphosphotransferase [Nocardioides sp. S-34]WQQ21538.1 exopolysaccharide biosynthesis polyprenyl glycosylphosphotransferase [Nocardioides sp. S-34]